MSNSAPQIPPGMKECFQCKSIIRQDVITCPYCGKNPSKAVFMGGMMQNVGSLMFILGLLILIPFICAMCGFLGN